MLCLCIVNLILSKKNVVWLINYHSLPKRPALSLKEERRLIAKAKKGYQAETEELVLRYVGFILFRLHKKAFPAYVARFGEEILFVINEGLAIGLCAF